MIKTYLTSLIVLITFFVNAQDFLDIELGQMNRYGIIYPHTHKNCFAEKKVKGRTITLTYFAGEDTSSKKEVRAVEEYDIKGNVTAGAYYTSRQLGEPTEKQVRKFTYNSKGRVVEEKTTVLDTFFEKQFEYDSYGDLTVERFSYDTDKAWRTTIVAERNDKGQPVKQVTLMYGDTISYYDNKYDVQGRLIETGITYPQLHIPGARTKYYYYPNDSIKLVVCYNKGNPEGWLTTDSVLYNANGQPIQEYHTLIGGEWATITTYTYDARYREIEKITQNRVIDLTIKVVSTYNGCLITKREFYYSGGPKHAAPKLAQVLTYSYQY